MTDMAIIYRFLILFARVKSHRKNDIGRQKYDTREKLFIVKLVYCFKLMTVSNWLRTFETLLLLCPYILWLRYKLSVYSYELWTMYNEIQVRLFIDTYINLKWVTLHKLFQIYWDDIYKISEWDLVRKIIKSRIMFYFEILEFGNFQNEEEK